MELTQSFTFACPSFASRNFAPPHSVAARSPLRQPSLCLTSQSQDSFLPMTRLRLQSFPLRALVGDTSAVRSESNKENFTRTEEASVADVEVGDDGLETDDSGDEDTMIRVCDKLIDVFMVDKPNPADWRILIAFSKEWSNIRPLFYKRCQEQADEASDPGMKHKLLRLKRKLKEVDDDIQRHNELLESVRREPSQIREIVSRRRKDFTEEFFAHVSTVAKSYFDNPEKQDEVIKLGNECLAAVQAYDSALESVKALESAQLKLQDIFNSPSADAACRKIDELAQKNQIDSTTALLITKAWSAASGSNMTNTEAKDIMFHLYKTALASMQKFVPKEIRIVKHLLTIEDPEECLCALNDAFTPGEELEQESADVLYTTPEKLCNWIQVVVDAYHLSREGTLIREARDLMKPKTIEKMEELKKLIQDKFM